MSITILQCSNCYKDFECENKAYNRAKRLRKQHMFCSRSCSCSHRNKNLPKEARAKINEKQSDRTTGNKYNYKGVFTYYLNKTRNRNRGFDLDEEYLVEIWQKQNGRCALSNIVIHLKDGNHTLSTASLDRIDSNIGYLRGNVQFVAYAMNLAKNKFSDQDVFKFLQEVKDHSH